MARSVPKGGGSSVTEATTLVFPKKSIWEDLAKTKRETKKRSQSQSGIYGAAVKDAVEKEHVDRKALAIVLKLEAMDDEDLHVTVFHIIDGLKKLGILTRAMAQEEMFEEHKADTYALINGPTAGKKTSAAKPPKGRPRKHKGATGDDLNAAMGGNVTPIGAAARRVAEAAGGDV
jgi:hypothetical protein